MTEPEVRQTLRTYILEYLMRDAEYPLNDDEGIITNGLLDSMSLTELQVYIEEEYDVYIPDPQFTVENMDTLDLIVARVMRGLGEK